MPVATNDADRKTRDVSIDIAQDGLRRLRLSMQGETVRHYADIAKVTRLIQQLDELRLSPPNPNPRMACSRCGKHHLSKDCR